MVVLALRMVYSVQGQIGEALDEFHQAMRSAAEQQEIALICQYEIGEWLLIATFVSGFFFCKQCCCTFNDRFNTMCTVLLKHLSLGPIRLITPG